VKLAPVLGSLGTTINCSSNSIADRTAVSVKCTYDITMYSGYSVCLQNQIELYTSKCISSTESGSMLTIIGTVNGEHLVLVNPIWIASPPMGMLESPYTKAYSLTGITTISTIGKSSEELLSGR